MFPNLREAKNEKEKAEVLACYKKGMTNGWASGKYAMEAGDFIVEDDRLSKDSIGFADTLPELKAFFKDGGWTLGTGVIYKNLFFLQQIDGGDEWAVYEIEPGGKVGNEFESITMNAFIKPKDRLNHETFEELIHKLEKGGKEYWESHGEKLHS